MKHLFVALSILTFSMALRADTIAYDVTTGTVGNQNWQGDLGLDFNVDKGIFVNQLGVFDSGQDGIVGTINVALFDRTTGMQVSPTLTFTGNAGMLNNGSRFLSLPTPLFFAAGTQLSIVATGYGSGESNYNTYGGPVNGTSTENSGGAISFVGGSRYDYNFTGTLAYPNIVDGGPTNRYDAGTFTFAATPEPGAWMLLGTAGACMLPLIRRRRASK